MAAAHQVEAEHLPCVIEEVQDVQDPEEAAVGPSSGHRAEAHTVLAVAAIDAAEIVATTRLTHPERRGHHHHHHLVQVDHTD